MSRIGKQPVVIPSQVTVTIEKRLVTVKGPKGELSFKTKRNIEVQLADGVLTVLRKNETKVVKALHGTTRNLIRNLVVGVSEGFKKTLELVGTGYRAKLEGKKVQFSLGLSHPVIVEPLPGIELSVEGTNKVIVSGIDKQVVGQMAANIRALRPPEPYKGKGIRYEGEVIIKKAGKAGKGEK